MPACPDRVRAQLEEWGFEVVLVDVSEFHKGGGSIRCLTNPVDVRIGRDLPAGPGRRGRASRPGLRAAARRLIASAPCSRSVASASCCWAPRWLWCRAAPWRSCSQRRSGWVHAVACRVPVVPGRDRRWSP